MISVVICSRASTISAELAENLRSTIGCEYELVVIDNSSNEHSIFTAYNLGIDRSRGELICFIHDDILMRTADWGKIVEQIFAAQPQLGLLGIAGSKLKTRMPSGWWDSPSSFQARNLIQHHPNGEVVHEHSGFEQSSLVEVVVIDGVFMALRRATGIQFNTTLTGFHCYDLCLALECRRKGYRTFVTDEVLLEHFSLGSINRDWFEASLKLHHLYRNDLPLSVSDSVDPKTLPSLEFENGKMFIKRSLHTGIPNKRSTRLWLKLWWLQPWSEFHRWYWNYRFRTRAAEILRCLHLRVL